MQPPAQTSKKVSQEHSDAAGSILVRSTNWLGDAVMTLPALTLLRQRLPAAHICVLSKPGLEPIYEASGVVDEILIYSRRAGRSRPDWIDFLRMAKLLSGRKFSTAVLFQGAFEAALLARVAGIPIRIGYATQGRAFLLTTALEKSPNGTHEVLAYRALVDAATGVSSNSDESGAQLETEELRPVLTATETQRLAAFVLLAEYGVRDWSGPIAILNAGATNSRAKRWPEGHFADLAGKLRKEGYHIVLVGSRSEREIAERISLSVTEEKPINLAGMTDLSTLIGLLSIATVVVSNDTGTAHVAAALRRPTLTLFGPTNEFETAPIGRGSRIVRAPEIECERCMLRDCPIDHRCLVRILPGEVLERTKRLLRELE